MPEQRNLILAIVLSVTIIIAFQYFYELPRVKEAQRQQAQPTEQMAETPQQQAAPDTARPAPPAVPPSPEVARTQALASAARVAIANGAVEGSLALTGGRIDNLVLSQFRETTAPDSPGTIARVCASRAPWRSTSTTCSRSQGGSRTRATSRCRSTRTA
jgi:YidC/Oxa1 family membrane protein insertase